MRMLRFALAAALSWSACPALAQDDPNPGEERGDAPLGAGPSGIDVSGGIALMTDYRFRGVSRSDEDPAVQASLNLFHDSGLYAGMRATTLRGRDPFRLRDPSIGDLGDVEFDLYAGYNARLGGGFEADAGILYYAFAGGEGATDYVEPYASLSYLIGPVMATAGAKYAPSQRAIGDEDGLYLFGQVDVSIPFRPWSFSATLGHQDWSRFGDYWTWSVGVEHQLRVEGLPDTRLGISYVDTDLPSTSGQDAGIAATIRLTF